DLPRKGDAPDVLVGGRGRPAPATERELLLRLGELAFEPLALVEQGRDARFDVLRRGLERGGDRLERFLPAHDPLPRRFARERLDPAHARADRAFGDDPEEPDVTGRAHVGPAAQLDRIAAPFPTRATHRKHAHLVAVLLAE